MIVDFCKMAMDVRLANTWTSNDDCSFESADGERLQPLACYGGP